MRKIFCDVCGKDVTGILLNSFRHINISKIMDLCNECNEELKVKRNDLDERYKVESEQILQETISKMSSVQEKKEEVPVEEPQQ